MHHNIPRLMIAGPGSGAGKTTLSCALLLALHRLGHTPAAFKCGPDYIDPMFHERVLGLASCNLDIVMCGEAVVTRLLAQNAAGHGLALIEGVMGLYDGQGTSEHGSSNHVALLTKTPTVMVLGTRGQSVTLAAQLQGYCTFAPNTIKGVILNQTSEKMYRVYKPMLEDRLGITVYGHLPPVPEAAFSSRHLGLVPPEEVEGIQHKLGLLADACAASVDLDGLLALARSAEPLAETGPLAGTGPQTQPPADVTIAVARDAAFCFYYRDTFDYLRELGARLDFFSPLADARLPEGVSGLILGGGYPEEYAAALAANESMRQSVRALAERGLPVFAECGGFMYLCRTLRDRQGVQYPMTGLIGADTAMTGSLGPFGYVTLTAAHDTFLCRRGETVTAHEFHYSGSTDAGSAFLARKVGGAEWPCIHASRPDEVRKIFAGYPHTHFRGNPGLASSFVAACREYLRRH